MAINYLAWLNIILLAVKLLNIPSADEGITVKIFPEHPAEILLNDTNTKVFHIDLFSKKTGVKIKGYILIPRQDIFASEDVNRFLFPFVPNATFLTVNEFSVIYEEVLQEPMLPKSKTILLYVNKVERILDVEKNNKPVERKDNYSTRDGIQVIQTRVFPQYVELQVAKDGSSTIDYKVIRNLFPHKMILLSVIPDTGKVIQLWLNGGNVDFPLAFFNIQEAATKKISQFLTARLSGENNDVELLRSEIKKMLEQAPPYNPVVYDFFNEFIDRILLIDNVKQVFSEYQPKQTPDKLTDFMPQVAGEVKKIPEAETENLRVLCRIFKQYKKTAKKQHGEWVEGNMLLGGSSKEYKPSEAELLLGETGNRILTALEKVGNDDWVVLKKQQRLRSCKLKFIKFSFIHYDVMGSGRFFYVDKMIPVTIKWNNKKFEVLRDSENEIK